MHPYSINTDERNNIFFVLSWVGILSALGLHKFLVFFKIDMPWWLDAPSALGFYGIVFVVFDKWMWRLVVKTHFLKTPDLSGNWDGFLKTSFDKFASERKASLHISQTWTHIKVILKTAESESSSEAASLVLNQPEGIYLNYQYFNHPKADAKGTMHAHMGTVRLVFDEAEKSLAGHYYSGRDRNNWGLMQFRKLAV